MCSDRGSIPIMRRQQRLAVVNNCGDGPPQTLERRAFGGTNPSCSLVLRSPASHIEPIGGSNSTVPQARILYRALLVAKVRIDQPIALGITLRPLEVVEKGPGMKGTHPSSIGDRASQFREHFAVPLDATAVGYAAVFFFIGSIEIPAAALGNFDDRVVVLP